MWDGVTGPLTWRQFHRLAGRGNEDLCEPQPVPPLLVGHERDWVSYARQIYLNPTLTNRFACLVIF